MASTKKHSPLHIFFFPFLAHGHITPMVDLAKLFSSRGVKSTIITTPLNASLIPQTPTSNDVVDVIHVKTIDLPYAKAGLPYGCENLSQVSPNMIPTFLKATTMLAEPLARAMMMESKPDWVVADMMFPWVARCAAKYGIPTLVFNVVGFFASCAHECMRLYRPYDGVLTDSEVFVVPGLPGGIRMTRIQVADYVMKIEESEMIEILEESHGHAEDSDSNNVESYGVVVNSFCELEQDYVHYYRNALGKKAWHIGPVSLYKANRGKEEEHECLKWLHTKKPNSVIYICFGTLSKIPESQLTQIAMALEASNQQFIWIVIRKIKKDEEEWLPSGFEKRTKGKGLIIRDWAPQVKILEHEAIGAFVTHCGWNSILEAVSGGVPMMTWPMYAEQFYNEKLVSQVLRIGVPVGAKKWTRFQRDDIKWDAIEKAVKRIMEGEEAEEMRNRAKVLACKARKAVEKDGSSYSEFNALIHHLSMRCHH